MSLKREVISGTKWIAITNVFKQVLLIISLIVFARLLTPEDFGVFAILMIFIGFLNIFTDMGTSAAIIHIEKLSDTLLSSIFYFNILIGITLFLLLTFLAFPIAYIFETPALQELIPIISVNFIIMSFGVVQKALYEKELDFKKVTLIESFAILVSTIVGISFALYGYGVYSLVFQTVINSFLSVILMWMNSTWRPKLYFSLQEIKSIWKYTSNLSYFNIVNYFARNSDNLLIGKFLGSAALGVYSLAYKIMLYPLQNISHILIRILFPSFSLIKNNNKKLKKAYLRVIFFIALISFPIMTGLMATADIIVDVIFGNRWQNLAIILIILAPIGIIQSIVTTIGSLYMAKGNTKQMFQIGIVNAAVTVISFIIGLPFGIEGVAFAYAIANLIMLYPNLLLAWKQIELSVLEGMQTILPIALISILMGLIVLLSKKVLNTVTDISSLKLVIIVFFGILVYAGLIRIKYGKLRILMKELKK